MARNKKMVRSDRIREFEIRMYGSEPVWADGKIDQTDPKVFNGHLMASLNWYNTMFDNSDCKKAVMEWMKVNGYTKEQIEAVDCVNEKEFRLLYNNREMYGLGADCRLMTIGCKYPQEKIKKTKEGISILIVIGAGILKERKAEENKPSVQDHIKAATSEHIGKIEHLIDLKIKGDVSFDTTTWLKTEGIKPLYAKQIASWLKENYLNELNLVDSDPELQEAYSHLDHKSLIKFIESIMTACDQYTAVTKGIRKTRKKKIIPAAKQVSKLRVQHTDSVFELNSVPSEKIVGANELWIYNTKGKMLGFFRAVSDAGLKVKNSSIIDYDKTVSKWKKVRKPQIFIKGIQYLNKRDLTKIYSGLKAKEKPIKSRTTFETVLVKVF